jgi:hypothetical protein
MYRIAQDSIKAIAKQCITDQLASTNDIKKISDICSIVRNNVINDENDAGFTRNDKHIYISIEDSNITIVHKYAYNTPCHYTLVLNNYTKQLHKYLFNYLKIAEVYMFTDLGSILNINVALSDEVEDSRINRLVAVNKCIDELLEIW